MAYAHHDSLMTSVATVSSNIWSIYLRTESIVHCGHHNYLLRPVTPVPILAMPSDTPGTPNHNIILGPCKHQPTQCLHENGDPLTCKRVWMGAPSAVPTVSNPPTAGISPTLWVLKGATSVTVSMPVANRPLLLPGGDTADSSDDRVSKPLDIQPIDVDASDLEVSSEDGKSQAGMTEWEDDDDAKLGKSSSNIADHWFISHLAQL